MSIDREATKAILLQYMREGGMDASLAPAALENFVFGHRASVFVGECGLDEKANAIDPSRYLSWLQLGLAFLRANFSIPTSCRLGLAWFEYLSGPFPVIALVWDSEETPSGVHEASTQMEKVMCEFNRIIDWRELSALLSASPSIVPPSSNDIES